MNITAVIFDLDGVLVHTDHLHYLAWKQLSVEEGIPFDESVNHRLRGVSRLDSLDIILEQSAERYTPEQKLQLAERKNNYYKKRLQVLTPSDAAPGARETLNALKQRNMKAAIGSSSKNAPFILERLGLSDAFDAVADGNSIQHSKPDPEVFLLAARLLGVAPEQCLVVEDAEAGVQAARQAGMKVVFIGRAYAGLAADAHLLGLTDLLPLLSE